MRPRSVCLIAGGMSQPHSRLQPWRYLVEVTRGLAEQGHPVLLVSDGMGISGDIEGVQVCRLESIRNPAVRGNKSLGHLIQQYQPEVTLWHSGLLSFLHQNFSITGSPKNIGIFTSPIYHFRDLIQLGLGRVLRSLSVTGAHLAGSCLPRRVLRTRIENSPLDALVVQTRTTCHQLWELGVKTEKIVVIPPGVDPEWNPDCNANLAARPFLIPLAEGTVEFVYFGPAEPLRGFDMLLKAFTAASAQDPGLKLQALVRNDSKNITGKQTSQDKLAAKISCPSIQVSTALLSPGELASRVAAADVVVLPFELVSSDAPLSLLEAAALGKPVVTTLVACLPELVASVPHFFAQPADPDSLFQALLHAARYVRGTRKNEGKPVNLKPGWARTWQEVGQEWSHLIQSL